MSTTGSTSSSAWCSMGDKAFVRQRSLGGRFLFYGNWWSYKVLPSWGLTYPMWGLWWMLLISLELGLRLQNYEAWLWRCSVSPLGPENEQFVVLPSTWLRQEGLIAVHPLFILFFIMVGYAIAGQSNICWDDGFISKCKAERCLPYRCSSRRPICPQNAK